MGLRRTHVCMCICMCSREKKMSFQNRTRNFMVIIRADVVGSLALAFLLLPSPPGRDSCSFNELCPLASVGHKLASQCT